MNSPVSSLLTGAWPVIIGLLPIVLTVIFATMAYEIWIEYKKKEFLSKLKYSLLEIRLPKEITKSPLAMELLFSSLHMTGGDSGSMYDKITKNSSRPVFSLEIASIGGQVRFFIRTRTAQKKFVESQIYAQYPGIEVTEVPDYTEDTEFDPDQVNMWGADLELNKSDAYPIKTYVDFGLDKNPEEEMKVDPITPVLELLGTLTHGEQIWIQIIVRAHKAEGPAKDGKPTDTWKDAVKKEIEDLKKKASPEKEDGTTGSPNMTKGQTDVIAAMERNITKLGFDCGIRVVYIADKDVFDGGHISGILGVFKQYNSDALNGFKPAQVTSIDFPWQDIFGKKIIRKKKGKLNAYKNRLYFSDAYGTAKPYVLNTESLATIFHFPGNVAQTPTFTRVLSKKAEPPANLPI